MRKANTRQHRVFVYLVCGQNISSEVLLLVIAAILRVYYVLNTVLSYLIIIPTLKGSYYSTYFLGKEMEA